MNFSELFLQRIYTLGFLFVIILLLADILAFFYYPKTLFNEIFLVTREQTPLTWLSTLVFFFIALSCFNLYIQHKQKIWYILVVIFLFFSMDDAIYLHERLSGYVQNHTIILSLFPSYSWIILYFPLLVFALITLFSLLWRDVDTNKRILLIISFLLLGIAIFLDFIDGFVQKDSSIVFCIDISCHKAITHIMRLSEEILEVIALGILGYLHLYTYALISIDLKK